MSAAENPTPVNQDHNLPVLRNIWNQVVGLFTDSEHSHEDAAPRRLGYMAVVVGVFGFGGWAACAPIEGAALAPGVVQVDGKRQSIQHLEGGIIGQILVTNGDEVVAGQPLVILDETRSRAELEILSGRLFQTRAEIERLIAERDDEQTLAFSDELKDDIKSDVRARSAAAGQTAVFRVRRADREGEIAVLQTKVAQLEQIKAGLSVVIDARAEVLASLSSEIEDLRALLEKGYVDRVRIRELERAKSDTAGSLAELRTEFSTNSVAVEETNLKIAQLQKRFKTEVVDQLTSAQEYLHDLSQEFDSVSDRVNRATVTAPTEGVIMNLGPNTVGEVVGPGETIAELVPNVEELMIEARISPMDIDRVFVGQDAEVRMSVFKDAYLITGVLVKLSADRMIDDATQMPYYAAEIRLKDEDADLLEGLTLVPGMPAEVLIKTGTRTLLGYVYSPINRLFSRALTED